MSSSSDPILIEKDGNIRIVTLNRPEALNATNGEFHCRISEIWMELAADADAGCVILTGAGRAFSAGGDFGFMLELQQNAKTRDRVTLEMRRLLYDMIQFPLPIIAAVNGPAMGLGCSLALSTDIVLMSDRAKLADPHVNVGLVAGDGGAALWPLFTSMLKAKEYLLTGDDISPDTAVQLGLANRVVPHDELMSTAKELAQKLLRQPQQALRATKKALNNHIEKAVAGPLEIAIQAEIATMTSEEHIAFVDNMIKQSEARKKSRASS